MSIPEVIPIAYEPNYRTGHVGNWADGQFMGNIVRKAGHRRAAPWLGYLHVFNSDGDYLKSRTAETGVGEEGREAAARLLSEWLDTLPGLAYGPIAIKPFRAEYAGTTYGLIVNDGHGTGEERQPGERIELHPDGLGFREPWDGTYDT